MAVGKLKIWNLSVCRHFSTQIQTFSMRYSKFRALFTRQIWISNGPCDDWQFEIYRLPAIFQCKFKILRTFKFKIMKCTLNFLRDKSKFKISFKIEKFPRFLRGKFKIVNLINSTNNRLNWMIIFGLNIIYREFSELLNESNLIKICRVFIEIIAF